MNPTIRFSESLNSNQIQGLLTAIRETTGLLYGFHPLEMVDCQFISAVLTLCKKNKIGKEKRRLVDASIRAWSIGYGLGNPRITWPE